MAEDNLNASQSLFSSVLGLVSREIQDFVVTAVTGSSTTLSHQSSQNNSNVKHKRSRSTASSRSAVPSELAKRKRRPSSPHPKNLTDEEDPNMADGNEEEGNSVQSTSKSDIRRPLGKESNDRPGPSKRPIKTSRRISSEGGVFKMPELPTRPTMPGSLWPRSPTPADWNRQPLHPEVPAPISTSKPAQSTTPTTSPNVHRDPSPESSRPPKRARSRRRSSVRFAPQAVLHPAPPARSPTPTAEDVADSLNEAAPNPTESAGSQPTQVKVEDDDEIVILDKMPSPPPAASSRGRSTKVSKHLGSISPGTSSGAKGVAESAPEDDEEERGLQPNLADMSVSELLWNAETTGKGKGKEVARKVDGPNVPEQQSEEDSQSSENARIRRLEEEIERLRNELSFHSSTNSSVVDPPPPPPAPPLPPAGYIAIPATSWANGHHPSQRPADANPRARKSLQSIVPAETMEKFLSELKTVKLRNTGSGTTSTVSPYTMRQAANSSAVSLASSEMTAGLQSLRAGLKRKRASDGAEELQNGLHEAVRRRFDATSPTHQIHESHGDDSFASQGSSGASSSRSQSSQNGRSQRSNDPMAISWSYPGPIRPFRASQPEDASSTSAVAREPGLHRSLAAPPVPLPIPGLGGSDLTTPSLSSDTEVDGENEQDYVEPYSAARDEVLTPPAEEDLRHIQTLPGPSKSVGLHSKAAISGRQSDLRLEELDTQIRQRPHTTQQEALQTKPAPARISQVRRVSHPPPVQGSPNVFLSRQPKSPLPAQHVRKPLPPARATSSRKDGPHQPTLNESQASSSTFHLHTSAVILQPEPDMAQGDGESEQLLSGPTPGTPAYEEYSIPVQLSTPPLETSTRHRIPTPGLKLSQLQDPKGKRRADDSLSLDEEMRRVSANERIADLDIDLDLEGLTDAEILQALEADTTVYAGLGSRTKTYGYTSGGGAAGTAVTMDPGLRRQQSGEAPAKMKSRIPIPKPLSRSR
ncbi:hypothetical protein FRB90_002712 [Tulasnella sp. 427]|nr:hypothetical protein FRB90_002712 [Tulasnella sp. 427]